MKSIKQQYIDLKEGRMSQHNFMRSVRMSLPQYITNVTSFNDTVKILKNKGILNEVTMSSPEDAKEQWFEEFQNAIENMDLSPEKKAKAMKALDHVDAVDMYGMFQPRPGAVAFISDIDDILSQEGDEEVNDEDDELEDLISKYGEEESGKYTKFQDFPGGISEESNYPETAPNKLAQIVADEFGDELKALSSKEKQDMALSHAYEKILSSGHPKAKIIARNLVWGYADEDWPSDYISALYNIIGRDLNEAKKKKEKKELHPNQIHPQELRMGIKVELEHTDNLDKAKKIALDHLAENPFYYTALKLAGVESPSAPKAKYPKAAKKEKADEAELVDKENAMKPVKGIEKIKASSNKAHKETNSVVKGVEELTHNAKTVRGLQKFAATGGKMKAVREGQLNEAGGEYTFTGTLTKDEMKALDNMLSYKGKYDIEVDEIDDHYETTIRHDFYNELNLKDAVDQVTGRKPQKKQFGYTGGFGNVLQSQLEALVREVLDEIADGGDDMNPQFAQDEIN